jgi:murein DD-endopeptidase MepM/ murein hydrolase activator NlpD
MSLIAERPRPVILLFPMLVTALLLRSGPTEALAGDVLWPVTGPVVAEFDPPDPDWMPGHRGVDLTASPGSEVRSPRAGTVAFVGRVGGVPVVVVTHGSARATYQPVVASVQQGWPVAVGDLIGTIAPSGGHCAGRCLHWGLRIGERYADPRLLLGRVHVVLTPAESA